MGRTLRAVESDEKAFQEAPKTLAEATERSRRELLVRARLEIASAVDAGVPAHALGRLIAEMDRLDTEIRRMDAADEQEAQQRERSSGGRRSFQQAAI